MSIFFDLQSTCYHDITWLSEELITALHSHLFIRAGSTLFGQDQCGAWLRVVESMITGEKRSIEEDDIIAMLRFANASGCLYQEMREYLKNTVEYPLLPLYISCHQQRPLDILFKEATTDPPDLTYECSDKYAKV